MMNKKANQAIDKLAKICSTIFHPLFIPLYGMIIIFSAPTLFGYLPFTVKKLLLLIVLINNVILPISLLPLFKHRNLINSWTLDSRTDRNIPLAISSILYAVTAYIMFRLPVPIFLKSFILSICLLTIIITFINLWWKISLHAVGAGLLTALVIILAFKMYTPLLWYIILVIITGGVVLSSRLRLNAHNPLQIWLGFLAGFLGFSIFMTIF
jgi:hypothetical protein